MSGPSGHAPNAPRGLAGMNERSLFLAALDIEDPSARSTFLDAAREVEPEVRERVRRLLQTHKTLDAFMGRPASSLVDEEDGRWPPEGPGHIVGDFVLIETLGEGGFGVVYLAEQTARPPPGRPEAPQAGHGHPPGRRPVRGRAPGPGADGPPEHRPDLRRGRDPVGPPLLRHGARPRPADHRLLRRERAAARPRLELFVQRLPGGRSTPTRRAIIHRDLKPSNVLVAAADGGPLAKVIDFGIAKATGRDRADGHSSRLAAFLLGTPAYMSPEQAERAATSTRGRDIYSLGVLLYEILAGAPAVRARATCGRSATTRCGGSSGRSTRRGRALALAATAGGRPDRLQAAAARVGATSTGS